MGNVLDLISMLDLFGSPDLLCAARQRGSAQVWQLDSKLVSASDASRLDVIADIASGSFVAA